MAVAKKLCQHGLKLIWNYWIFVESRYKVEQSPIKDPTPEKRKHHPKTRVFSFCIFFEISNHSSTDIVVPKVLQSLRNRMAFQQTILEMKQPFKN
jgi:hypothetical protein